jgi:hypothetical protein
MVAATLALSNTAAARCGGASSSHCAATMNSRMCPSSSPCGRRVTRGASTTTRAVFDPDTVDDPLLRQALKEPVAFFGGLFAGMLGRGKGLCELSCINLRNSSTRARNHAGLCISLFAHRGTPPPPRMIPLFVFRRCVV